MYNFCLNPFQICLLVKNIQRHKIIQKQLTYTHELKKRSKESFLVVTLRQAAGVAQGTPSHSKSASISSHLPETNFDMIFGTIWF